MYFHITKKTYKLLADASQIYPFTGKSTVTSLSFNFLDEGKIVLACYSMDKKDDKNISFLPTTFNPKDSFRINTRSHEFANYLKKKE